MILALNTLYVHVYYHCVDFLSPTIPNDLQQTNTHMVVLYAVLIISLATLI